MRRWDYHALRPNKLRGCHIVTIIRCGQRSMDYGHGMLCEQRAG